MQRPAKEHAILRDALNAYIEQLRAFLADIDGEGDEDVSSVCETLALAEDMVLRETI